MLQPDRTASAGVPCLPGGPVMSTDADFLSIPWFVWITIVSLNAAVWVTLIVAIGRNLNMDSVNNPDDDRPLPFLPRPDKQHTLDM